MMLFFTGPRAMTTPLLRAPTIRLHPADTVVIAREDLPAGTVLATENVTCRDAIPQGHKLATVALPAGTPVRRYGQVIGFAATAIPAGSHVHVHNVELHDFVRDHTTTGPVQPWPVVAEPLTFQGYRRADGRIGTRNYVAVLGTVNCSATVVRQIVAAFPDAAVQAEFPGVDGVIAITHGSGCAMAADGVGLTLLQRTLAGYARHPNVAAALWVGLGCEVNHLAAQRQAAGNDSSAGLVIQDSGGSRATIAAGIARLRELLTEAARARRSTVPASGLVIGLQCGGSDSYSGISANPALGVAADMLVQQGGTVVLSETPEIYGAEHLLIQRAVSADVAAQLMARIRWWEAYCARHGGSLDNNPSPGNKAGGLTTILEKSLGAIAKGGSSPLRAVCEYAEPIPGPGLVFMDTPGYDPCSATGQIAGGANLIAFTTGRGSVSGFKPSPCLKIATNSSLFTRLADDMDLNAGTIIDGDEDVTSCGARLFARLLAMASGSPSCSEQMGFGELEFVPWSLGTIL